MKRYFIIIASVLLVTIFASGCGSHDWFGPLERGARTLFNGWDMWDTPMVRPYEDPMPPVPTGSVAIKAKPDYQEAWKQFSKSNAQQRNDRGLVAYRRFCHHCHGANGDGRIIVGESFSVSPPDLRSSDVQEMSTEDLFEIIAAGSGSMLGLAASMTPLDILFSIHHMRSLKDAPSKPYFAPRNTQPVK